METNASLYIPLHRLTLPLLPFPALVAQVGYLQAQTLGILPETMCDSHLS